MQTCDLTKKKPIIIKYKNLLSHIKMSKEVLTFGNTEIEKKIFFTAIRLLFLGGNVDIEKMLVSNKFFFGKKTINTLLVTCIMIIMLSH